KLSQPVSTKIEKISARNSLIEFNFIILPSFFWWGFKYSLSNRTLFTLKSFDLLSYKAYRMHYKTQAGFSEKLLFLPVYIQ
ncbi:hypothetical protein, partial [Oleiphilus sp. HI0061]|uniref:hypothetical protein n=1 Tax=Oleiphilus sp. HI0061 TaxID=1822239 RepID=UPI001E420CC5